MSHGDSCFRNELLELLCDDLDALDAIMHKEDLAPAIDFAQNSLTDQILLEFANGCANGQALLGRRFNHTHIAHIDQ